MEDASIPAKEYKLPLGEFDTDFKKEFPPDTLLGHELDDGARVWRVYRKEATAYDNDMLDGWGGTLDILLIFAGLFSAVATAFVIESYTLLQPDNTAYIAAALYIIASATNASASSVLPPPPSLELSPAALSRWINGLWFTSLLLSVTVAFLCILVKQWIREYKARNTASARSPRHWARRREIFFRALDAWPVEELVSILPVLLHVSLFFFFAGIIAFLWSLDRAISTWIVVLSLLLAVFYAGCTLIPVWIPECPTSTPLAHMVRKQFIPLELLLLRACAAVLPQLQKYGTTASDILLRLVPRHGPRDWRQHTTITMLPLRAASYLRRPLAFRLQSLIETVKAQQSGTYFSQWSERDSVALDAAALRWAILEVSDSDSVAVGLQALGALPQSSALARVLRLHPHLRAFAADTALTRTAAVHNAAEALRVVRSMLCMQGAEYDVGSRLSHDISSLADNVLSKVEYPDAALVHAVFNGRISYTIQNATAWRTASPTLTSTALLLMQTRRESPYWTICLLLCCDLKLLLDADWLFVIGNLSKELTPAQSAGRLHFCRRSKEISVAELVATVLIKSSDSEYTAEYIAPSAHVICRLLLQIPSTDYGLIARCPSLLNCLTTGRFFTEGNDVRQLAQCLWHIGITLPGERNLPKELWHAVAHLVHKSPPIDPDKGACSYTASFCVVAFDAALQGPLPERDSRLKDSLDLFLRPLGLPDVEISIWAMFSIDVGERTGGYSWLTLALTLSTALCAREIDNDHNVHMDAYFAECSIANFMKATSSLWSVEKRTIEDEWIQKCWLRLVQHNVGLRPRWWKELLESRLRGWGNADIWMMDAMDEELKRNPVCESTECPAHQHTPEQG